MLASSCYFFTDQLSFILLQAKNLIKQQIADDRRARLSRGKMAASPAGSQHSAAREGGEEGGGGEAGAKGGEAAVKKSPSSRAEEEEGGETGEKTGVKKSPSSSSTCRLQVHVHAVCPLLYIHVGVYMCYSKSTSIIMSSTLCCLILFLASNHQLCYVLYMIYLWWKLHVHVGQML